MSSLLPLKMKYLTLKQAQILVICVNLLMSAAIGLSYLNPKNESEKFLLITCVCAVLLLLGTLYLAIRNGAWTNSVISMSLTFFVGIATPEYAFLTQPSLAMLLPPIIALIFGGIFWSVLSMILLVAIFNFRTDFSGIYATPQILALLGSISLCLVLARHVFDGIVNKLIAKEDDLIAAKEAALTAKKMAEAANLGKTKLISGISHEIRTPLGSIIGFCELLSDDSMSADDRKKHLKTIAQNGRQLSRIVDDLLDIGKIEAGKFELEISKVSVQEIVLEILNSFSLKIAEKKLKMKSHFSPHIPNFILTDSLRLRQILLNILSNAIKFTEFGEINVKCNFNPDAAQKTGILTIDVQDTGMGIAPEVQNKLFQPFVQANSSIARKFGGSGLGLVLAQSVAQALGGSLIILESVLGKGSTFRLDVNVNLDIKSDDNSGNSVSKNTENEVDACNNSKLLLMKGIRVLVVDDAPENRYLIKRFLDLSGAYSSFASNGQQCVEMVLESAFDIVLMDIQMPIMDGNEAVKILRLKGITIPIVALSAHSYEEEHQRSLENGFNDFISKPVTKRDLELKIFQILKKDNGIVSLQKLNSAEEVAIAMSQIPILSKFSSQN